MVKVFQIDTGGTLTTGLVSYYKMEGSSADFYGSYNGTDNAVSYGTSYGKVEQGANSASISTAITNSSNLGIAGNSNMSVALWFQAVTAPPSNQYYSLFDHISTLTAGREFAMNYYNNAGVDKRLYIYAAGTSNTKIVDLGTTWHFLVASRDGVNSYLYIDNVLVSTAAIGSTTASSNLFNLGGAALASPSFNLDEVGIWNKVLSTTEISDLYNGGNGQTMVNIKPFYNPYRGSIGRFFAGDPSLVGYWQLQGNSWDNSGNANNGTDTAVTYYQPWFRDDSGSAAFTIASNSAIQLSDSALMRQTGNLTVHIWAKITVSSGNTYPLLFQSYSQSGTVAGFQIQQDINNHLRFVLGNNTGLSIPVNYQDIRSNKFINDSKWHLFTCVYDGTNIIEYIDGKFEVEGAWSSGAAYQATNYVGIGKISGSGTIDQLQGYLSEIGYFSRAFSAQEISQYYQWATSSSNLPHKWLTAFVQAAQNVESFFMSWFTAN